MLRLPVLALAVLLLIAPVGCGSDSDPLGPDPGDPAAAGPPEWLLQGWIWPIAQNAMRTYDFTGQSVGGVHSVSIRNWQQIGTLGWQSNQLFTFATFTATDSEIVITSATGYQEGWQILQRTATTVTLRSLRDGGQVVWYNCSAPGWPALILHSTRGCG